jgi:hypothetical protein
MAFDKSLLMQALAVKQPVPYQLEGQTVFIKQLTVADHEAMENDLFDDQGKPKAALMPVFIQHCVVDDNGAAIFTADDIEQLAALRSGPIKKLFDRCNAINGAGSVEQQKKN